MEETTVVDEPDLPLGPWIFSSQTIDAMINDPTSIFADTSSEMIPDLLEPMKFEMESPETEQDFPTTNPNENYIIPPAQDTYQQPAVINSEDYPGPYSFEVFIDPHTSKSPWVFSSILNKVYILLLSSFPVDFKWIQDPDKQFYVRAMPLYSQPQDSHKPVMRCFNHSHENEKTNKGLPSHIWKHIIRVNSDSGSYVGEKGQHLSVVVPLGQPQTGVDTVRKMYEFVCQNSCPSGMNRRPIEVVFTLEDETGHVHGRRSVNVRICSCPKRDKEKEEKENFQKNGHAKPPVAKKRKAETSERKPSSFSEAPVDTKEYQLTMKIAGKNNLRAMLKHGYDLMAGESLRSGLEEPYKSLINKYSLALKNIPD